ncbi:MAG: NAD(P)/FAD-dependent oxidoreductase [Cephaloticoccus sp.]
MPARVLIVGQGLAGTVLGWTLSRAGIDWSMVDAGHPQAASRVAAGIINPVTGQRWVKTWRIDELWADTRAAYQAMAADFDVPLWRDLRIRRYWRTDKGQRSLRAKLERGVLAPWVTELAADHAVLAPAGRVDVPALLAAARARWLAESRLTEAQFDWSAARAQEGWVIDCTGAFARSGPFASLGFAVSKGEVLRAPIPGLNASEVRHRGHWVLPDASGDAWIGATHEPGVDDVRPTAAARAELLRSAEQLSGTVVEPSAHGVGLRLAARDMRPRVGVHPAQPRLGLLGALGSKGVLYAPWLARQWVEHLRDGAGFDPAVAVRAAG